MKMEDITADDEVNDMEMNPLRPERTLIPTRTAILRLERGRQDTTKRLRGVLLPRDAITDAERLLALPTAPKTTPSQHVMRVTSPSDRDFTRI
ncbi:uncharacterized protein PHALS_10844 [Plasmopara halstedii]|uniref:Uncharacterized protein n=1 Tax=Plasmopara halstedii TaxID=4781 RepID=A0A0P1AIS7_PLAHL|nr:uncharacterized protein PHALS_10844 [Plasmopara halstedii]CEG40658.1 hypothetical protein PHALS_10844 [Plasmopara halstedii]|eukprot:XP_024577027.1 hypothetical protein PHALS_10844 [Plasmopara halstedii]